MAGTYKLIEAKTLASSTASVTFSSIPATYTDIVIRFSVRTTAEGFTNDQMKMRFNGITTSSYSYNFMRGDGSSTAAYSPDANETSSLLALVNADGSTSNTFSNGELYIPSYLSSTKKPSSAFIAMENNATSAYITATAGLGAETTAISSVTFFSATSASFVSGSTFYLYGIEIPAQQITAKATGGDISYDATYIYHTFRQSGTFTPTQSLTADYLVVAGGGGSNGAQSFGGGGGGGGVRCTVDATGGGGAVESALSLTAQAYTVTVGAGGAQSNNNGNNSVFSTITSTGGGYGGSANNDPGQTGQAGSTGGSGGGGGAGRTGGSSGARTINQGFVGGTGGTFGSYSGSGGGGGGAGQAGANGQAGNGTASGAKGGDGVSVSISGSATYYGGGGGTRENGGGTATGGLGGGGQNHGSVQTAGEANTGGGAGGGGANGGSGIVIVRYAR
jgi:hypothetical protein